MLGFTKAQTTHITQLTLAIGEKDGRLYWHNLHMSTVDIGTLEKLSMKDMKALSYRLSHDIRDRLEADGYKLMFLCAAVGLANKPLNRYGFSLDGFPFIWKILRRS